MYLGRLFLLLALLGTLGTVQGQDIHYTLFNMAPLKMNPATTGNFYGTVRAGGIFRDQWYSILDDEYRTPSFYFDAPIIRGLRDQDWVGVGLQFVNDRVGLGNLRTSGALLSASYHYALDRRGNQILTLGVQGGSITRKLETRGFMAGDAQQLLLEGTNNAQSTDPLLQSSGSTGGGGRNQADLNGNYLDINAGIAYKSVDPRAGTELEMGLAVGHINRGDESFGMGSGNTGGGGNNNNRNDQARRPMSFLVHGRYLYPVNDKWSAEPTFLFQTMAGAGNNIILQGVAGYQFNEQIKLRGGLGYRVGDSGQILLGAVIDELLQVGLSYDLNVSQLSGVSNYQGGFEIAASYIIRIYKQPEINPSILCPRF